MTGHRDSQIRRELTSLISPRRIRAVARELGAVRRRRKVDVVALVYSLVLGFATGDRRTLAGLRRAYERVTGTCLAPSAFYDRFTPQLASVMKRLLAEVLERINAQRPRLHLVLNSFRQVLVADGTVIRLHEGLAPAFPSIWTNHMPASAKLHAVMNLVGRGPSSIQITHGSRHDLRLLRAGAWMRDKLLIFDLGYFQGYLFNRIGLHGGFFLSRLKQHTNPLIVAPARPEHQRFVGEKLQDVVARLHGTVHYQTHRSKWRHHTMPVRVAFDRWAVLFSTISRDLLDLTVGPISQRAFIAVRLRRFLLHEAPDPNRRRLLLPVRAQLGRFGALG